MQEDTLRAKGKGQRAKGKGKENFLTEGSEIVYYDNHVCALISHCCMLILNLVLKLKVNTRDVLKFILHYISFFYLVITNYIFNLVNT